jgi:hypothetical protein
MVNRWQGILKNFEDLERVKKTLDPILGYGIVSQPPKNQLHNSFNSGSTGASSSLTPGPVSITSPTNPSSTLSNPFDSLWKVMGPLHHLQPHKFHELVQETCRNPDFRRSLENVRDQKP